jgi:fibronectin type 3 domain-containing protein
MSTYYGSRTALDPSRVTSHLATITGLAAATTYHFRVMSRDASGILVTSLDYTFRTRTAPVSVTVSPTSASVTSGKTQQFTATVANSSNQSVTWSATAGTISSAGLFTAPTVTADLTVTVKATSVADTTKSASAAVTVKPAAAALAVNSTSLTFAAQQGGAGPAPGVLTVSNTGGGTLTYNAVSDAAWLAVSPASGTAPKTLQVTASVVGLVPGTYTGHITISAAGATNSPITVLASLTIAALPVQHSVDLSWNASTSPNVVSYSAYRSTTQGGPYLLAASAITGLAYTDATVQSGVTYYYVVTAFDDQAQESVYSNEVRAVVP